MDLQFKGSTEDKSVISNGYLQNYFDFVGDNNVVGQMKANIEPIYGRYFVID